MLQRKTIREKEVVAVSFDPTAIMVRKPGQAEYGNEEVLCRITADGLHVDKDVAEKYNIPIIMESKEKEDIINDDIDKEEDDLELD